MPEYLAPGVFVEEVPSGSKPIAGVSTSTIGMVGMTARGPVDRPTLVTSYGDFTRAFGGLLNGAVYTANRDALAFAVQGAFDNGAGRIYVNRIIGPNATYAAVDLFGDETQAPATTALSNRAGWARRCWRSTTERTSPTATRCSCRTGRAANTSPPMATPSRSASR